MFRVRRLRGTEAIRPSDDLPGRNGERQRDHLWFLRSPFPLTRGSQSTGESWKVVAPFSSQQATKREEASSPRCWLSLMRQGDGIVGMLSGPREKARLVVSSDSYNALR